METSAAKRRKTSPSAALPIESATTTTTPPDPPPLLAPPAANAPRGEEPRSARLSYASPTKNSLWRHHPNLPRLSSPTKARDAGLGAGSLEPDALLRSQLEVSSSQPDRQLREDHERAARRSPTRQLGGGLGTRPRRSPVKPKPRPLPPPGPNDDDDDVANPFARRGLRRSPLAGLSEPDPPEPELPPTPVHMGHAASTPPTGIHSTPSRRPRRSRALAEQIRSSPTKQPQPKPAADVSRGQDQQILPTTETGPLPAASRANPVRNFNIKPSQSRPTSRPTHSDVRGVETAHVNVEKKRERDALLREIAQLEGDLETLAQENGRIRDLQAARKEVLPPKDPANLFEVLTRHMPTRRKDNSTDRSTSWVLAALDPIAFLPFGKGSSAVPIFFPEDSSAIEPEQDLVSHHPLTLTSQEALPFLKAFTSLNFTSRITILPSATGNSLDEDGHKTESSLRQHHSITATSASVPGLFSGRIEITVNTITHGITSLAVPSIDPPAAAAELSPLTAKIISQPESSSSALSRNIGVLTWAMGSWLRIAVRRAKVWRALDRALGTVDAAVLTIARVRAARKGRMLKRKHSGRVDEEAGEGGRKDADSDGVADWIDSMVDTDELLPYMGRLWMDIRIPLLSGEGEAVSTPDLTVSILRVQWHIKFDWTGEGSSQIGALATLPVKWHHSDERTALLGIPALFDDLLRRGDGVVPAVETIVALLAGDPRD